MRLFCAKKVSLSCTRKVSLFYTKKVSLCQLNFRKRALASQNLQSEHLLARSSRKQCEPSSSRIRQPIARQSSRSIMGNLALHSAEEPDDLRSTNGTVEVPRIRDNDAALVQ